MRLTYQAHAQVEHQRGKQLELALMEAHTRIALAGMLTYADVC
jgi:hypothetical protein